MALKPIFLFFVSMGGIFYVASWIQQKYPPKKINHFYGYRTSSSMKSQERWEFAQMYSARVMQRWGIFLLLCSPLGLWVTIDEILLIGVLMVITIIPAVSIIVKVEKAIKEKFPHD